MQSVAWWWKPPPAASLVVAEPKLLLELEIVALDSPPHLGKLHHPLETLCSRAKSIASICSAGGSSSPGGHSIKSHSSGRGSLSL